MKRIVFDIETEPFSEDFRSSITAKERIKHAPKMRVACVFDESRQEYKYFTSRNAAKLIRQLQSADEVVSFNGKCFDLLVLRRHHRMTGRVPRRGRHIDLHEIMSDAAGFRVSLDRATQLNFSERKHTNGRRMSALTLDALKVACKSDVCHTYRLFNQHMRGALLIPGRRKRKSGADSEKSYVDAPRECPSCRALNCLEEMEWHTDEMSDGQHSDYLAGLYGSAECSKCGEIVDWGF